MCVYQKTMNMNHEGLRQWKTHVSLISLIRSFTDGVRESIPPELSNSYLPPAEPGDFPN